MKRAPENSETLKQNINKSTNLTHYYELYY